jgi:hypothetical protein
MTKTKQIKLTKKEAEQRSGRGVREVKWEK